MNDDITVSIDEIGKTLKAIRTELGLSQAAAAEGAGFTSPVTIGNYERGLRGMDIAKIDQILKAFGMGVESITFTQVPRPQPPRKKDKNHVGPL